MTAADHANTVRERDQAREEIAWLRDLLAAAEAELKEAYAKLERTNESFLATEAERDAAVRDLGDKP